MSFCELSAKKQLWLIVINRACGDTLWIYVFQRAFSGNSIMALCFSESLQRKLYYGSLSLESFYRKRGYGSCLSANFQWKNNYGTMSFSELTKQYQIMALCLSESFQWNYACLVKTNMFHKFLLYVTLYICIILIVSYI